MLNIDQFFFKAIDSNASIQSLCPSRIFNTARDKDAEAADKIPYIIVQYDGGSANDACKDTPLAEFNQASVTVLCCAETRNDLCTLTELVEGAIRDAFDDYEDFMEDTWTFGIDDATITASGVEMDQEKPCYFQSLTYQCDTYKR